MLLHILPVPFGIVGALVAWICFSEMESYIALMYPIGFALGILLVVIAFYLTWLSLVDEDTT